MEENKYTWLPFFEELLGKICKDFDSKSLYSIWTKIFPDMYKDIIQMDPFTLIGVSLARDDDQKKKYCEKLKEIFNLVSKVPDDFNGIPSLKGTNPYFCRECSIRIAKGENTDDVYTHIMKPLWNLANQVNNEKIEEKDYNASINFKPNGPAKLTQVIFICKPKKFYSGDRNNIDYLNLQTGQKFKLEKNFNSFVAFQNEAQNIEQKPYVFSNNAYKSSKNKKENNKNGDISMQKSLNQPTKNISMAKQSLNQILYGPPGTGKTFEINKIIETYIYPQVENQHNTDYDTFFNDEIIFKADWWLKIAIAFKLNNSNNKPINNTEICELPILDKWYKISNKYKDHHSFERSISAELQKRSKRTNGTYATNKNCCSYFEENNKKFKLSVEGLKLLDDFIEENNLILNTVNSINIVELAKNYYTFCTFHQSYSYEDFVEGIRPIINNDKDDIVESNNMQFGFHCGIFKDMCIKAKKEPNKKFFIFIDEINRGNISKIFGELITLIEPDKRENVTGDDKIEYHTIKVTLPYTNDKFTVPNNLYIIGTMNTADKSLALLDVALRRRFEFKAIYPKYNGDEIKYDNELSDFLETLNSEILKEKGSADYMIGHSYFMNGKTLKDLPTILNNNIIPLLMEYFNGKTQKIREILQNTAATINFNKKYKFPNEQNEYYRLEVESVTLNMEK